MYPPQDVAELAADALRAMDAARSMAAGVSEAGGVEGAERALVALEGAHAALREVLVAAGAGDEVTD